jgi:hypothetical protein
LTDAIPGQEFSDDHAARELAPIHGINLGFESFIGFLLVENSLREPAQESGGLLELANQLVKSDHSGGF